MPQDRKTRLTELLKQAQATMVELSGEYAGEQHWDEAKALIEDAKQVDVILERILPPPSEARPGTSSRKLPYYHTEGNKLVKVGASRRGGTYQHRVTREHYNSMLEVLTDLAGRGPTFETPSLASRCDIPGHEPLAILNMLCQQGLLAAPRRGQWVFTDPEGFKEAVEKVWNELPRQ